MNTSAIYHQTHLPYLSINSKRQVEIRIRTGKDVHSVSLVYGDPHYFKQTENVWKWSGDITDMELLYENQDHRFFSITIDVPNYRLKYAFKLIGVDTLYYGDQQIFDVLDPHDIWSYYFLPYIHKTEAYRSPEWVKNAIWYQIFPDRFHAEQGLIQNTTVRNDVHMGGSLKGINEKLPYLSALGITALYLTPIFKSPTVHKYDTEDYYTIDERFGTLEDFKEMVIKAHSLNIKVMLDAVFNHSGTNFFAWKEKRKEWYHFTETAYETFSFAKNMPKLNTENEEVIDYFCKVGQYWIQETDIDGWRMDVANELSPLFIRRFRSAVKAVKEDAYVLGELWHDGNHWLKGDMFDGVMNYPLTRVAMDFFIHHKYSPYHFIEQINQERFRYPFEQSLYQFNLYDSHDTKRLMSIAKGKLNAVKLAISFLYLMPGSPCIYYGTESGMLGEDDPDNRRVMIFPNENDELFLHIKRMIAIRKQLPALTQAHDYQLSLQDQCLVIQWITHRFVFNLSTDDLIFQGKLIKAQTLLEQ